VNSVPVTSTMQRALGVARTSWIGLLVLCVAWEAWLAPLRPGGSWLVLKAMPLLLLVTRLWRADVRALQWAVLLVLFYLAEGSIRVLEPPPFGVYAGLEIVLAAAFYVSAIVYLRPFKQAMRARKTKDTNA
jgi:uncharacterized membrane protein